MKAASSVGLGWRLLAPVGTLLLVLAAPPRPAHAWALNGVPVCTQAGDQYAPQLVADGSGGGILIWRDGRKLNGDFDIFAQRLDANGVAQWAAGGVGVCTVVGDQQAIVAASDGLGGVVIAWQDQRAGNWDIYAQRITSAGLVAPGWPAGGLQITNSLKDETAPVISGDGLHGAFIAWQLAFGAGDDDVYATRVTATGGIAAGWSAGGTAVSSPLALQDAPCIVGDDLGGIFVFWQDNRNGTFDIYGQRMDGSGIAQWTLGGTPICNAAGDQKEPACTGDGASHVILAWTDSRGGNSDIYAQSVEDNGTFNWTPNGVQLTTLANNDIRPAIVSDGLSGATVAWNDVTDGTHWAVYAQHVYAGGGLGSMPATGVQLATTAGYSAASRPRVSFDDNYGALVVWEDVRAGGGVGHVYAQDLGYSGNLAWPAQGLPICTAGDYQYFPTVSTDFVTGALFAWQDWRTASGTGYDIYAQRVTTLSNLSAGVTPGGFTAPIVPRNLNNATLNNALLTANLDGNTNDTYYNWATQQQGPDVMPGWSSALYTDEEMGSWWQISAPDSNSPFVSWQALNVGPNMIRGGRHSLLSRADVYNEVLESDETDNDHRGQWVWSPKVEAVGVPDSRPEPPVFGYFLNPNSDGFKFSRTPTFAWVVSEAPSAASDDYDLYVYDDDYGGPNVGFSNQRGASLESGSFTDFVVGHYSGTPTTLLPGVVRYAAAAGAGFAEDQNDASGRNSGGAAAYAHQVMAANRLTDVYEAFLSSGTAYHFVLSREAGTSDIAFEIFPGVAGGIYHRGQTSPTGTSLPVNATLDTLEYTATDTGWHPIVVYRNLGVGANTSLTYTLGWGASELLDAPDQPVSTPLAFEGAVPNPIVHAGELRFSLPRPAQARLALYDAAGRRVRGLLDGPQGAGSHDVHWDGRGADGARAGAGIYWARLEVEGRVLVRRVAFLP
jgi:hypothetical protein